MPCPAKKAAARAQRRPLVVEDLGAGEAGAIVER
jgi:hypothetical protein